MIINLSHAPHCYLPVDGVLNETDYWRIKQLFNPEAITCNVKNSLFQYLEVPQLQDYYSNRERGRPKDEGHRERAFDDVIDHLQEAEDNLIENIHISRKSIDDSSRSVFIEEPHVCLDKIFDHVSMHVFVDAHEYSTADDFADGRNQETSDHYDKQNQNMMIASLLLVYLDVCSCLSDIIEITERVCQVETKGACGNVD